MKEALKLAIEGGYMIHMNMEKSYDIHGNWTGMEGKKEISVDKTLLDPLFYKCLIKSIAKDRGGIPVEPSGKYMMHELVDHIYDGGTPDEFFKTIIK